MMINARVIKDSLRVIIDTDTIEHEESSLIASYAGAEGFQCLSYGGNRPECPQVVFNASKGIIEIKNQNKQNEEAREWHLFGYRDDDLRMVARKLKLKHDDIVLLAVIYCLAKDENRKTAFITERQELLRAVQEDKVYFPGVVSHSILNFEESKSLLDLFFKRHGTYLLYPGMHVNKGGWYLHSFKTKLSNHQLPWSIVTFGKSQISHGKDLEDFLSALQGRVVDLLIAIDAIGINHYQDTNNDIVDDVLYHFNYWITLYSGVLDTLAWITNYRYSFGFEQTKQNQVGIRNANDDFRRAIREQNSDLRQLITSEALIIGLLDEIRDVVVHRERLQGVTFHNMDRHYKKTMARTPTAFFERCLELCKSECCDSRRWGLNDKNRQLIEPFLFVKAVTPIFLKFVNEYLGKLEFNEWLQKFPSVAKDIDLARKESVSGDFQKSLKLFSQYKIGL